MVIAYLLLSVERGSEKEVAEKLKKIEGVKEVHIVCGIYDIIAKIEVPSLEKIKKIVLDEVRKMEKIRTSVTMIAIE